MLSWSESVAAVTLIFEPETPLKSLGTIFVYNKLLIIKIYVCSQFYNEHSTQNACSRTMQTERAQNVSKFRCIDETLTLSVVCLERLHEVGKRSGVWLVTDSLVDWQNLLKLVLLFTWIASLEVSQSVNQSVLLERGKYSEIVRNTVALKQDIRRKQSGTYSCPIHKQKLHKVTSDPLNLWLPIWLLTGLGVEQRCCCNKRRYHNSKHHRYLQVNLS